MIPVLATPYIRSQSGEEMLSMLSPEIRAQAGRNALHALAITEIMNDHRDDEASDEHQA